LRARRVTDFPFFDNAGLPMPFAHRGGALTADNVLLENSMRAFEVAVGLGYRHLETDVHASRDGKLVAFHDATLDRTTDGIGAVAALPYAEISRARIGGLEPIPLLSDILTAWPDVKVNIDAKSNLAIEPLAHCIDEHRAWNRVCVATFSAPRLLRLRRRLDPRVATAFSALGVAGLRTLPGRSLRGFVATRGLAAQVPPRRGRFEVVTQAFVDHVHELGKQVHVWTINAPDEMHRLLDLGVDAIMTDRIDLLRDVFVARGIWREPSE
jgi:glycerophosphoryl diester phosphodiesterase